MLLIHTVSKMNPLKSTATETNRQKHVRTMEEIRRFIYVRDCKQYKKIIKGKVKDKTLASNFYLLVNTLSLIKRKSQDGICKKRRSGEVS